MSCAAPCFCPLGQPFTAHLQPTPAHTRPSCTAAYNWHSVEQQLRSVAALRGLPFLHVLPGHGRRAAFGSDAEREAQLAALLEAEGYKG